MTVHIDSFILIYYVCFIIQSMLLHPVYTNDMYIEN